MTAPRTLPRRTVLAVSGTAVLAAAAACSSSDPAPASTSSSAAATSSAASSSAAASSTVPSSVSSAASSTVPPSTAEASSAPVTSEAASSAPPADPTPTGTPLATVGDVEAATSMVVGEGGAALLLAASNGTVVAHSAICTHQGCTVGAQGVEALCPCHQSLYDALTGAVLRGANNTPPGSQAPLPEVAVTVANGQVYAS